MKWLTKQLEKAMEQKKIKQKDIVRRTSLSKTFISNLFNNKHSIYDFGRVILIINAVISISDTRKNLSYTYYKLMTKRKCIRTAYEWLWNNQEIEELERLIKSRQDKEYNEVFKLMIKRQKTRTKNFEKGEREQLLSSLLEEAIVTKNKTNDFLIECLCTIFQMNIYSDLRQYDRIGELAETIDLDKISKNEYYKYSLKNRLNTLLAQQYWKQNNLLEMRKLSCMLIDTVENPYMLANEYHRLGMSYSFENKELALNYIYKSIELFRTIEGCEQLANNIEQKNIPFVYSNFNETYEDTSDIIELAYNYISTGKIQQGMDMLKNCDKDSPFVCFYLGKAKKDLTLLNKSHEIFRQQWRDHFFANLPLKEITKLNIKEDIYV